MVDAVNIFAQRIFTIYRTQVQSSAMLVSNSLTHPLTHCRLVNLIDVTLLCEDANSKLVTVTDVDALKRVGNSLVQILKLKLGHKIKIF